MTSACSPDRRQAIQHLPAFLWNEDDPCTVAEHESGSRIERLGLFAETYVQVAVQLESNMCMAPRNSYPCPLKITIQRMKSRAGN